MRKWIYLFCFNCYNSRQTNAHNLNCQNCFTGFGRLSLSSSLLLLWLVGWLAVWLADIAAAYLVIIPAVLSCPAHDRREPRVIDALQAKSTPFEMMLYPGQRHGVRGEPRQLQQWRTYLDFLDRTIGKRAETAD